MHEVLVNRLGGLSLPRKSVVRLTDLPDMTLDVYRGRKTTMQQQQQQRGKGEKGNTHLVQAQQTLDYSPLEQMGKREENVFRICSERSMSWPRGYKTFFMLNSTEHELFFCS